ncbi:MAG: acyl-CoA dehydrogenase family protein, partial [Burkholderiales bacterium]|nr:acyl-CoA dehydrogenase family protein [Burkholderiales bacterium]
MHFEQSPKSREWLARVEAFMIEHVYPAIPLYREQADAIDRWKQTPPVFEELKAKARGAGLWNLFMPPSEHDDEYFRSVGLTNLEYAPIAELMGRVYFASEVFNCMAPDTGNFEVLHRYGTKAQKERFMVPLAAGRTRSAFLMTEPGVSSSDARNIRTEIRRDGGDYVINGHKWWSSGAGHPHCDFFIVMGKTDALAPTYRQQSMVLVPAGTPGVTLVRHLDVFGYDHAPHGHFEVKLDNVRV